MFTLKMENISIACIDLSMGELTSGCWFFYVSKKGQLLS